MAQHSFIIMPNKRLKHRGLRPLDSQQVARRLGDSYTGVSTLSSIKLSKGVLLTLILFVLSAFIAIAAFFPVFNKTPFGMPSLLFMAIAIFLFGLQRTRRFSIAKVNFKNGMRFLNLAIVFCAVGTVIYAAYI